MFQPEKKEIFITKYFWYWSRQGYKAWVLEIVMIMMMMIIIMMIMTTKLCVILMFFWPCT